MGQYCCLSTELWPLIDVRIVTLRTSLMNFDQISYTLYWLDLGFRLKLGKFYKFLTKLWPLINANILFWLNIVNMNKYILFKFYLYVCTYQNS